MSALLQTDIGTAKRRCNEYLKEAVWSREWLRVYNPGVKLRRYTKWPPRGKISAMALEGLGFGAVR